MLGLISSNVNNAYVMHLIRSVPRIWWSSPRILLHTISASHAPKMIKIESSPEEKLELRSYYYLITSELLHKKYSVPQMLVVPARTIRIIHKECVSGVPYGISLKQAIIKLLLKRTKQNRQENSSTKMPDCHSKRTFEVRFLKCRDVFQS